VAWLSFEAIDIAWPRSVLAPPGAPFWQVRAIVLIFGVLLAVGIVYVLLRRPTQARTDPTLA
jgi:TRAP-type C4-dicarboxylate transport system permease small subunit